MKPNLKPKAPGEYWAAKTGGSLAEPARARQHY
jgi:hypothetical protein